MELKTCIKCLLEKPPEDYYSLKNSCKSCDRKKAALWRINNREKYKELQRNWHKYHPGYHRTRKSPERVYKILANFRKRIRKVFKGEALRKDIMMKYVGCRPLELMAHIESTWKEGMSWGNYGRWHIDHVIPVSSFNLLKEKDRLKAFNFKNLQALWAEENYKKGGIDKK